MRHLSFDRKSASRTNAMLVSFFQVIGNWKIIFFAVLLSCVRIQGFNVFSKQIYHLTSDENVEANASSYFGYNFVIKTSPPISPNNITFLVGAPKNPMPAARAAVAETNGSYGDMFSCPFTFTNSSSSCRSVRPADVKHHDIIDKESMGVSMSSLPGSDNVVVCAPLRAIDCKDAHLVPGSCFRSESFGRSWSGSMQLVSGCSNIPLDLMLVVDGSSSIDDVEFQQVKNWIKVFTSGFDIGNTANIGVLVYSFAITDGRPLVDQPYISVEIKMGGFNNHRDFENAVQNMSRVASTTYTAHAINRTILEFQDSPRFYDNETKKVMVVLTDGISNDRDVLPESASYARSQNLTVFAIGVGDADSQELGWIATGDPNNSTNVYSVEKFDQLNAIVDSLQNSILGVLEGGSATATDSVNKFQQSEIGVSGGYLSTNEVKAVSKFYEYRDACL